MENCLAKTYRRNHPSHISINRQRRRLTHTIPLPHPKKRVTLFALSPLKKRCNLLTPPPTGHYILIIPEKHLNLTYSRPRTHISHPQTHVQCQRLSQISPNMKKIHLFLFSFFFINVFPPISNTPFSLEYSLIMPLRLARC